MTVSSSRPSQDGRLDHLTKNQPEGDEMSNQRKDIHRPSVIAPADYEFISYIYTGSSINCMERVAEVNHNREILKAHMNLTGGKYSQHEHGGNCFICGAVSNILVIFYHKKTNTYIKSGHICAEKMEMCYDDVSFNLFKQAVRRELGMVKGLTGAERELTSRGLDAAFEMYDALRNDHQMRQRLFDEGNKEEQIIIDIVEKLVKFGSLTDKQYDYLGKLLYTISHRAEIEAQRAAEREKIEDVPEGRLQIVGEILSVKVEEPDEAMYPGIKMLVKSDAGGFKLWGTVPAAIVMAERGMKVQFTATVMRSNKDSKFGFFKRPTKAQIIQN